MPQTVEGMRRLRRNQPAPDLRYSDDEHCHVQGGVLYRQGTIIQIYWEGNGPETFTLPDTSENLTTVKAIFQRLKKELNT